MPGDPRAREHSRTPTGSTEVTTHLLRPGPHASQPPPEDPPTGGSSNFSLSSSPRVRPSTLGRATMSSVALGKTHGLGLLGPGVCPRRRDAPRRTVPKRLYVTMSDVHHPHYWRRVRKTPKLTTRETHQNYFSEKTLYPKDYLVIIVPVPESRPLRLLGPRRHI